MYWNTEPTAVIVVWDDWGGWFDHVKPWAYYRGTSTSCPTSDAPNGWGCGYVSGFRVPLLVVSPYTGTGSQQSGYGNYVSGACGASPLPSCPNLGTNNEFVHDFGSIPGVHGVQLRDEQYHMADNALRRLQRARLGIGGLPGRQYTVIGFLRVVS
jgi:hypothetical protein